MQSARPGARGAVDAGAVLGCRSTSPSRPHRASASPRQSRRAPSSDSSNSSGLRSRIGCPFRSRTVTSISTPAVVVGDGRLGLVCMRRAGQAEESDADGELQRTCLRHISATRHRAQSFGVSPPFYARRAPSIGLTRAAIDRVLLGGRDRPLAPALSATPGERHRIAFDGVLRRDGACGPAIFALSRKSEPDLTVRQASSVPPIS